MAAFSRSLCSRHFRTVLTLCKNEQPVSLVRPLTLGPRRQFSENGNPRGAVPAAPAQGNIMYFALGGMAAGVAFTLWEYSRKSRDHAAVVNDTAFKPTILTGLPPHAPARQISFPSDHSGLKLVLYQYPTCPFCCKVRAFLDYYGLSYDVVEVDPVLRTQMKWSEYKKVPILLAGVGDGKYLQLNDSTLIISVLKTYLADPKKNLLDLMSYYPPMSYRDEDGTVKTEIQNRYFLMAGEDVQKDKKEKIMEEVKWREWADKKLVHVLSPNVYRTVDESLQSFEWFSEVGEWDRLFPSWERNLIVYAGAYAMWLIGKRLKKRHALKDDVRASLYDELNVWLKNLKKKGTPFNGGKNPDLADLAVFGVLSSIEGCQAFKDAIQQTKIEEWFNAMKNFASTQAGSRL